MDKSGQNQGNRQITIDSQTGSFSQSRSFSDQLIAARFNTLPAETQDALVEFASKERIDFDKKVNNDQLAHANAQADIDKFIDLQHSLAHVEGGRISAASTNIKTASGNIHIESRSSSCYVATATYDNAYHPNVVILRDFRDRYLRKSFWGKCFIYTYYTVGPYLAYFPSHSELFKCFSKKMLDHIVSWIIRKYYGLRF